MDDLYIGVVGTGGYLSAELASMARGRVVGILPGTSRGAANVHLTISIPTGLGEARNALVVRASDVLIAIGGEYGTLSEIALALKIGRPVVGIGTWNLARSGREDTSISRADTAEDAVHKALLLVKGS